MRFPENEYPLAKENSEVELGHKAVEDAKFSCQSDTYIRRWFEIPRI